MNPTLSDRLRRTRRVLQKRRWLALVLHGGLAATVLLLFLAALNRWQPMQEQNAFFLLLIVAVAFAGYLGWISFRIWRRPVPLPELAAQVEEKHPEWMDGLICATEQEQKPPESRRPLEEALITHMRKETAEVDFEAVLVPNRWQTKPLLAALVALLLLAGLLMLSSFAQKGAYHLAYLLGADVAGITVNPGDGETPVRTDLRVTADILRWENEPTIEYIDETGRHRFPMHQGESNHSFTFYDIIDDIRYRIVTPSLKTPWYHISSYIPPTIDRTRVRVIPPAYTGLPKEEFDNLRGFTAIEGSRIEWELKSPTAASAALRRESGETVMESGEDGLHSLTLRLRETFTARFIVRDKEDRSARTPEFTIKSQPDQPPTIDVTRPGRDTTAEPEASVDLTAIAADDFGLTHVALHVSVSGQRKPPVRLFSAATDDEEAPRITERTVRSTLDLAALEAQEGDVVVYFFTATDNREPESQQTRSEVFFIEVREEAEPEEMEGEPMELEEIDLQALIVELKRLIRLSWQLTGQQDEQLRREIAAGLEEVRLETAGVQRAIVEQLGEENAAPLVALTNRAMQRMELASQLIDQRRINDAIPPQEMALADLVTIQNALMRNQTSSEESEDGSSGDSRGPQQEEMDADEFVEQMQQLMADVQRLSDDQAAQNSAMRRMASRGLSAEQQAEYQQRQDAIRDRTDSINQQLSQLRGAEGARRDLAAASSSMESASSRIEANQPDPAARDGDRARSSLLSALENLEDFMGEMTGNQVADLARQADQLARQQGEAAGGSRGLAASDSPSAEEAAALREQQQAMQQQLQSLLSAMDDTANQLRDSHPEASRAVAAASQQMRDENVAGEMGRAGNALLYRRYDRAADIQENVAENLGGLAESLDASANLMPAMSRQQMQQLLAQLQQAQQEVMGMTGQSADAIGERLEQITSRMGDRVGRAGQALRDQTLQELSGQLGGSLQDGRQPNIFRTSELLRAASRTLEQQMFAQEIDRRARLQRQVSEPPERYRGLVEEYFKDLSETP